MKLVLLDLDNTLIGADYNLTVSEDELRTTVSGLSKRDIRIGLCSDSALITLRQWSKRLKLTGPIVAERGAVIWDPIQQTEELIGTSTTGWFRELRELFVSKILRDFPCATIILGDATRFVKDRAMSSFLTEKIFAVNGFRTASFSFFAFRPNQDRTSIVPDAELLDSASSIVSDTIESLGMTKSNLFWDENPMCGILIVHALTTKKWRGVSALMDRLKPEKVVMVGNGMSDFLELQNVLQYAVGNADPRYKEKSSFVAQRSLTEGVIECLQQL